jgi:hypothetical protein
VNPFYDPKNPYISGKGIKTSYSSGPIADAGMATFDSNGNPWFDPDHPEDCDKLIDNLFHLIVGYSLMVNHAEQYFGYLQWRKWEWEHGDERV